MQTTSGRSPGTETNSKSSRITRAKGRSSSVTARPLLHEHVVAAVDKAAPIAKRQTKDPRRLDFRPIGISKSAGGCRKALVGVVLPIGVHSHPAVNAVDQCNLFRSVPLVHLTVRIRAVDWNDS